MKLVNRLVVLIVISCVAACYPATCAWSQGAFKSELVTRLEGGMLGLEPIRAAVAGAGCEIVTANDRELTFRFSGRTNNVASVATTGDISIRSARELKSFEHVDQLYGDLAVVYSFIAKVSPNIPEDAKFSCLYFNARFRLSNPKVFKRLVFPEGHYVGKLVIPQCTIRQARVVVPPTPHPRAKVVLRDETIYDGWYERTGNSETRDLTRKLTFATLDFSVNPERAWRGSAALEVITDPTDNYITYTGGGIENVIVTPVLPLSGTAPGPGGQSAGETEPPGDVADIPEGGTYVIPVDSQKMQELVNQIAEDAAVSENPDKPKKVAILDFELIPQKSGTQIDRVVARNVREDLSTALSAVKCFRVLERSQLAEAIKNLKLDQTGIIDSETAKTLGKMVSADYVLVGSVSDRSDKVVVQARMIDAEKGETTYTARVEMRRTRPKESGEAGASSPAPSAASLEELEKAVAANPLSADAYADLALYWDSNNDPGRYAGALAKALHLDPDRFAAGSRVYNKLAPIVQNRGDMLAPTVRLVSISGATTAGIDAGSSLSARDDSLAIEAVDDVGLVKVELYIGDAPFPRSMWPLQGQHAALIKLKSPWIDASAAGPKTSVEIKVADTAGRKGEQKLTLRVTR